MYVVCNSYHISSKPKGNCIREYISNRASDNLKGHNIILWISHILITICFVSCSPDFPKPSVSFYYWKTEFKLSKKEEAVLKDNQVNKLYVRYFDVGLKDKSPIPIALINFIEKPKIAVIPVVYIKNKVLLEQIDIRKLAKDILTLVYNTSVKQNITYNQLQLDCDWTLNTKSSFFKLIKHCKELSKKEITSTIRLHQVKHSAKTGIPDVNKGVLMYYNMGKIAADSLNSIYERDIAIRYIQALKRYPLELNVALPIYNWGVHIRENKVIGLLNKINLKHFLSDTSFKVLQTNLITAKRNILKAGYFFKKGDNIKIEAIKKVDIEEMIDDLSYHMNIPPKEIIFFDLDDHNLDEYNYGQAFQKLCNSF